MNYSGIFADVTGLLIQLAESQELKAVLERTSVFVDTSYLLANFYSSWGTGARGQLEIDLKEVISVLGRMISQQLNQPVQRQP